MDKLTSDRYDIREIEKRGGVHHFYPHVNYIFPNENLIWFPYPNYEEYDHIKIEELINEPINLSQEN